MIQAERKVLKKVKAKINREERMRSVARNKEVSYEEAKLRVESHQLEDNGDSVVVCHRCRRIWLDLSQVGHSDMCNGKAKPARFG